MNPTPVPMQQVLAAPISASNSYASEIASLEEEQLGKAYGTPSLLPKHKIFISHSGSQKDFAEQLCVDLETHGYYPFFDKRPESLPKGKDFPPLIFQAARECLLAIVLISEEFLTRSTWPMLELAAFVKAKQTREDMRILPVLLGLEVDDLRNTEKWSKQWTKWGEQHRRLTDDVIKEWKDAVQSLGPVNMIFKRDYDGDVKLRKGIVKHIMRLVPPDIRSDVLHVQGRERFCKEARTMFGNVQVLGVHGIAGLGKSTLCMILAEDLRSEFLGRVCIVELGKGAATVDLYRQVLRQLCRDDLDFLNQHINTEGQGLNRLKERICKDRVFLAIDNVSDDMASIYAATSLLRLKFHPDSKVLVTSRSDAVLCGSLGIPEQNCKQWLGPTKEEARMIMLDKVNLSSELLDTQQLKVLDEARELSYFEGYHPLALQLFAAQLGTNQSKWKDMQLDLDWTPDAEHFLFSKIETNYRNLPDLHTRDMFMDIALFTPECLCGIDDIIYWLTDTIGLDAKHIEQKLRILRVKALIEIWKIEDTTFRIHELFRALAQRNAKADVVSSPRYIYQAGGKAAPRVLESRYSREIERAMLVDADLEMLELEACENLKVLSTRRCEKLRALGIQRLAYLVSLEVVSACTLESLDMSGLSNLRWLHISSCKDLMQVDANELDHLRHVSVSKCGKLTDLDLKKCSTVRSVSCMYNDNLGRVNLGNGGSLKCLTLWFCGSLADVEISGVAYLTTLKKRGCHRLLAIQQGGDIMCRGAQYLSLEKWGRLSPPFVEGLEFSASLRVLDIWNCCMSRLPNLRMCLSLQELRLSNVDVLLESYFGDLGVRSNADILCEEYKKIMCLSEDDLVPPLSLEDVRIENCKNVVVKEIFWKVQGLINLRIVSLQDVRVGWDWELYADGKYGLYADIKYGLPSMVDRRKIDLRSWFNSMCKMDGKLLMDLQANLRCEMQIVGVAGCLKKIKLLLELYCHQRHSHWFNNGCVCLEAGNYLLNKNGESGAKVDLTSMGCTFWESMSEAVEIKGSVCWIVEQIILQTLINCDSLCEFMGQERNQPYKACQDGHMQELFGQLHFLTGSHLADIVQDHGMWKVWERMIIDEVISRRASTSCERAETVIEKGAVAISKLEKLLEGLELLCACRGWQPGVFKEADRMYFASEWLVASRMCLLLEELKNCLVRQSVIRNELESHINDLQELQRCMDFEINQRSWNKYNSGQVLQRWKVRQWVQEVESCLSKHLRSHKPHKEESLTNNESVCILPGREPLKWVKKLSQMKSFSPHNRSLLEDRAWSLLERAKWNNGLAYQYSLYCGSESLRDKHLHWMAKWCSEAEWLLREVQVKGLGFRRLVGLAIQLDMQLWQYQNFETDCISIGGKKQHWIHIVEKYISTSVENSEGGADAFVWPYLLSSRDIVKELVRGLMGLLEVLCLKKGTSSLPCDLLISRFSLSLRNELDFLLHARIYSSIEDKLFDWWNRAELTESWMGLLDYMTCYGQESWLGAESGKALRELLEDFQSASLEFPCVLEADENDMIQMEAGDFRVKTLRSPSLSKKCSGNYCGCAEIKRRASCKTGDLRLKTLRSPTLSFRRMWVIANSQRSPCVSFSRCSRLSTFRINNYRKYIKSGREGEEVAPLESSLMDDDYRSIYKGTWSNAACCIKRRERRALFLYRALSAHF